MRALLASCFMLLLPLAMTAPIAAQDLDHLVGTWDIEFVARDNPVQAVLEIAHADTGLKGTWTGPRGDSDEIENVATDGKTVSFSRQLERQGQSFELHYTATVEDHKLTGKITTPRGEIPFTGKKR